MAVASAVTGAPAPLYGQRATVGGNDLWFAATGEHRLAKRLMLTVNVEERRSYGLLVPRQFLMLGGVLADLGGGRRFGAGGGLARNTPNEDFGPSRVTNEYRTWQQFTGSHQWFGAAWNHRTRWEQRWLAPVALPGIPRDWSYTSRLRHQLRVVTPLDGRPTAATKFYAMPNAELFVRTTDHRGVLFDQTRMGLALGLGVADRVNVESGVMRQSIIRADGKHERHHVLQFTARVLLSPRATSAH